MIGTKENDYKLLLKYLFILMGIVFIVRVIFFLNSYSHSKECILKPDSLTYENPAISLIQNGTFSNSNGDPEISRTPGYPVFIALVYKIFGSKNRLMLIIIQNLIGILILLFVFLIGTMLFTPKAGFFAALLIAFDPMSTIYPQMMLTETLATFINTLICLFALYTLLKFPNILMGAILGITLAAGTFIRPINNYLVFFISMGFVLYAIKTKINYKKIILLVLLVLIPSIVSVNLWRYRNYRLTGTKYFSSIQASSMLRYRAAGVYAKRNKVSIIEAQKVMEEKALLETDINENIHHRRFNYGLNYIKQYPFTYLKQVLTGIFKILFGPGLSNIDIFSNSPHKIFPLFSIVFLIVFYVFQIIGMRTSIVNQKRNNFIHSFLFVIILYFIILSSGAESNSRFRVPFIPLMALYAGYGLYFLLDKYSQKFRKNKKDQKGVSQDS